MIVYADNIILSRHTGVRSGISRSPMSLGNPRVMKVSPRLSPKLSATADFALWIQHFEIYLSEAEIPAEERARELVSLLNDGPFCIITQLGLVNSNEYGYLKEQLLKHYAPKGDDLEWQH